MEYTVLEKLTTNPFIKNLTGTKKCNISTTKSNEQYSTYQRLGYPLDCANIIHMILCSGNKAKNCNV